MVKSISIRVTPNVKKCLEELRKAIESFPAGEQKKSAEGALDYLDRTFKGERQPSKGTNCPGNRPIVM
jgi:hypothetical protein